MRHSAPREEHAHGQGRHRAFECVIFSLRDRDLLVDADRRSAYRPLHPPLATADPDLESWLLACAACAHPAHEIPVAGLVRLPELFPFAVTLGVDHLRRSPRFDVQRQGGGLDMVRPVDNPPV